MLVNYKTENTRKLVYSKEKAKIAASVILRKIIPEMIKPSAAASLINYNAGNLKKCRDGKVLIKARPFVQLVKKAYALSRTYDVDQYIDNSSDLKNFLSSELEEEYTNPDFFNDEYALNFINAINTPLTRKIWAILFTRKIMKVKDIVHYFGKVETMSALRQLASEQIILYHKQLNAVEINSKISTTSVHFDRQQIKLIVEELTKDKLSGAKAIYDWDSILLTGDQEKILYQMFYTFKEQLAKKVIEFELTPATERTKLCDFTLSFSNTLDLKTPQEEVTH